MTWYQALLTLCKQHTLSLPEKEGDFTGWLDVPLQSFGEFSAQLKASSDLSLAMLIDVAVVDYLHYGLSEWQTSSASGEGFSRGVYAMGQGQQAEGELTMINGKPRFALCYQWLSLQANRRLAVKVWVDESDVVPSLVDHWPSAVWFEREAYDLFGVDFTGHPDLRRLLTDYGFQGHPFRKDFPLEGHVELRYDGAKEACVYEPVSIEPRVTVPKVVRSYEHRYEEDGQSDV